MEGDATSDVYPALSLIRSPDYSADIPKHSHSLTQLLSGNLGSAWNYLGSYVGTRGGGVLP